MLWSHGTLGLRIGFLLLAMASGSLAEAAPRLSDLINMGASWGGPSSILRPQEQEGEEDDSLQEPRSFQELEEGLPPSLEEFRLKKNRNYIILINKAPNAVFDFRSGEQLRRSLMTMDRAKLDIGHAMVAWQCRMPDGRISQGATGQTGEVKRQGFQMLKSGWGMTTFMSTFTDGYLNLPLDVEDNMADAAEARRLRFVAFEVSAQDCQNALSFLQQYADGPQKAQTKFGLNVRPELYQGGGCGSFALVFLQKAGLIPEALELIWRDLEIPSHLLGRGTVVPPYTSIYSQIPKPRPVSLGSLGTDVWIQRPGWPASHHLRLADPEMMLHFIQSLEIHTARSLGGKNPELSARNLDLKSKTRDLRSRVSSSGEPSSGFRVEVTRIDGNFDVKTLGIENQTKAWLQDFLKKGGRVRSQQLYLAPGLIFERSK